jgi:hypothetical protein
MSRTGNRAVVGHITAILILSAGLSPRAMPSSAWSAAVQQILLPMPIVHRSIVEKNAAPAWLRLPPNAELRVPSGVRLEVVSTAIVSHDGRKEAALVGVFSNVGRPLTGAALRLSLVGQDGVSVVSSSSNGAAVSEVPANGLLPFRFPLVSTSLLPSEVAAIRLSLTEDAVNRRRSIAANVVRYSVRGTAQQGTVVTGQIDLAPTRVQEPREGLIVTVLLLDKDRRYLDILAGDAAPVTADSYRFELRGTMPVAKNTRDVQVWAEAYSR